MNNELEESRLMNAKEVAHYLGIGRTKVYAMFSEPDFPCIHVGKMKRVRKKDLLEWLIKTAGRRKSGGAQGDSNIGE